MVPVSKSEYDTLLLVLAHTTVDSERMIVSMVMPPPSYEEQIDYYHKAVVAVRQGGLDPFSPTLWDDIHTFKLAHQEGSSAFDLWVQDKQQQARVVLGREAG